MSARNKTAIPPLLEPYLRLPPEASLILLTGVLNATPHWLITRALRGALGDVPSSAAAGQGREVDGDGGGVGGDGDGEDVAIVLVSWQRDWEFWKAEARRGVGLDLPRLAQANKFAFVDGLTNLFSTPQQQSPPSAPLSTPQSPRTTNPLSLRSSASALPSRSPAPSRGAPTPSPSALPPQPRQQPSATAPAAAQRNLFTLTSPSLKDVESAITSAITALSSPSSTTPRKVVLILDSPATLLAVSPPTSSPSAATAATLTSLLLTLRTNPSVHSAILSLECDIPLLHAATASLVQNFPSSSHPSHSSAHNSTGAGAGGSMTVFPPLETETARFIAAQAHLSRWIVGVRGLDTGVARDVSGVVRVVRGGGFWDLDHDGEGGFENGGEGREIEVLYHVLPDGSVTVFERGGGNVG